MSIAQFETQDGTWFYQERPDKPPYWECLTCGARSFPLTDDTICHCKDPYDPEWQFVEKEDV